MAHSETTYLDTWIPLQDGRRLAARLWLPEVQPAPVIFEYLPYRKGDGTAPRDATTYDYFVKQGYAGLRVDITGTGDSEGVFDDEYSEQELSDGEEVIDWIAQQSWCDGNVGMIGISWGGFNGLQLASRQPEALKAVVSVASTVDRYADDIHYMGGCLLSDNINWGAQLFAYMTRPVDPVLTPNWRETWLERLEHVPFSAVDWLRHPTRDAFWKHGSVCEDWAAIKAPVLAMTGWSDAYVNAPTALAANLTVPSKAMIGPWEHKYAHISRLDAADFHGEVLAWFDRWLRLEQNEVDNLPDYRAFMQEHYNPEKSAKPRTGRWVAEANWPSENVKFQNWFLSEHGFAQTPQELTKSVKTLAHVGQASGYYCPGMRIDNEFAGDQAVDDALSVCFDSNPMTDRLELLGRPKVKIRFSVDQPVAQLVARLCDVSPDGVSQRVTYRPLNLTHCKSHETPARLVPGEIYEAEIELNECAHAVRPGHVLRLALSTSYWPIVWPAPVATKVTLHLEGCHLALPVREVAAEILPMNPGAARDFPVIDAEPLRAPTSEAKEFTDDAGVVHLHTFDDYGKTRNRHNNLEVGSTVCVQQAIHPDDPASAEFAAQWSFTFARGDWQVEIATESRMWCDANQFHISRSLRATEGPDANVVLEKEWSESVARGLL